MKKRNTKRYRVYCPEWRSDIGELFRDVADAYEHQDKMTKKNGARFAVEETNTRAFNRLKADTAKQRAAETKRRKLIESFIDKTNRGTATAADTIKAIELL